ncbi:MAG: riboflavin biosynthesis protein RibF [Clostridia bacterium]|nr:riboflavin biosynthesis protein RibF [Clostridia bacterium]
MKYSNMNDMPHKSRAVALGLFDSLHCGHLEVIKELLRVSTLRNLIPTVQTFRDFYLKGDRTVMTVDERIRVFEELGVMDELVLEFNSAFKDIEPEEFIEKYVIKGMNAECVVVGSDYRFGKDGRGDTILLEQLLGKADIELIVVPPVMTNSDTYNGKISTSLIKKLLDDGKVDEVCDLCNGRCYSYSGVIVGGNRIGRTLGFPTVNIIISDDKYIVRRGVYLSVTRIEDKEYNSISNVGLKPTIEEKQKKVIIETHLYDFNENVYGKTATVSLTEFIRDEMKFNGLEELQKQVLLDKENGYRKHSVR